MVKETIPITDDSLFKLIFPIHYLVIIQVILEHLQNAKVKIFDLSKNDAITIEDLVKHKLISVTTEELTIEPRSLRIDLKLEFEKSILLVEFLSRHMNLELAQRSSLYSHAYNYYKNKENKEIRFLVLSTAEKTKICEFKLNSESKFTILILSILELDPTEIYLNSQTKVNNAEEFNDVELIKLTLAPLVAYKKGLPFDSKKSSRLMEKITFKSQEEKDSIYAFAYLVANMVLDNDDENKKDILGVYMQKIDYAKTYFENLLKKQDEIEKERDFISKENESLRKERNSFSEENESLRKERNSFSEENESLNKENKSLKEKLAKSLLLNGNSVKQVSKESGLSIRQIMILQMSL